MLKAVVICFSSRATTAQRLRNSMFMCLNPLSTLYNLVLTLHSSFGVNGFLLLPLRAESTSSYLFRLIQAPNLNPLSWWGEKEKQLLGKILPVVQSNGVLLEGLFQSILKNIHLRITRSCNTVQLPSSSSIM